MEVLGFIGIAILLGAFFANLTGRLEASSRVYQSVNAIGAAIAARASYGIRFAPFVVLEGTWCVVALVSLTKPRRWGSSVNP